jgi:predicted permease
MGIVMPDFELLSRIFSIIFPVVFIVIIGFLYGKKYKPDMSITNQVNVDVLLPALIIDVMAASGFNPLDYGTFSLVAVLIILGSGLVAYPISRLMGFQWKTFVPPMMFNNSGNMGVPIILFAFGQKALSAAVILMVIENFLHFSVGQKMLDNRLSVLTLLKKPIILATFFGLALGFSHVTLSTSLTTPIHMLGQSCIPVLLFSLGVRMVDIDFKEWKIGVVSAIVSPLSGLLIALPILVFMPLPRDQIPILILFSVMPPAVLNFIVAERYKQEPHLVASIVLMGNLGSMIVLPITFWFIL